MKHKVVRNVVDEISPISDRKALYICVAIAAFSLFLMLYFAGDRSLWEDDMAQIYFISKGQTFREIIDKLMYQEVTNPPLSALLGAVWIRIAPYGTAWMKLPCIISVFAGTLLCGIIGIKLRNGFTGIMTTLFCGASTFLVTAAAYTFRAYGFLFLLSAFLVWCYSKRMDHIGNERTVDLFKYGIAILLLAYMHYFGILVILALFIGDVCLFLCKKIRFKCIYSYIGAGILFIPWFVIALIGSEKSYAQFWPGTPTTGYLLNVPFDLSDNRQSTYISFFIGVIAVTVLFAINFSRRSDDLNNKRYLSMLMPITFIFVLMVVYIYSRYIAPDRSVWVYRYFVAAMPMFFLTAGIGTDVLVAIITEKSEKQTIVLAQIILIGIIGFQQYRYQFYDYKAQSNLSLPFEESAEWIYSREDANLDDTMAFITSSYPTGWNYYLSHNGERDEINYANQGSLTEETSKSINTIYWTELHALTDPEKQKILDEQYQLVEENPDFHVRVYKKRVNKIS